MKLKDIKWATVLWLVAIGSCSIGTGFKEGIGAGFGAFGVGLILYFFFVRDGDM
ncbi:MAG: hypothetical protein ACXAC5_04630 [Promethearchaeota archaeon]|jgi:hypothetical protein